MALRRLKELKPGYILKAPVWNWHGQLLLRKGVELTERHLDVLAAWGVAEVEIQETTSQTGLAGEEPKSKTVPPLSTETVNHLEFLFRRLDRSDPVVAELFQVCAQRKRVNQRAWKAA